MDAARRPSGSRARPLPALAGAYALLALILGVDLLVVTGAVLIPLLVVGPLVAAVRGTSREVALVGFIAVIAALLLGPAHDIFGDSQHVTAALAVSAGSLLAVAIARGRELLETQAARQGTELASERMARRRSELLARSGELLGSPLDADTMLAQITGLAVPDHADLAIVDLLQPDGTLRGAVTSAADRAVADGLLGLRERFPLDPAGQHPVAVALRTGEPQLLREMPEQVLRVIANGDEHLELMRAARYHSALVLPLTARGRTSGVLSFLRMRHAAAFDDDDLELGLDLARRAALALDNARLFRELQITEGRMEAIVTNLGEAVCALAPDGAFIYANQAAADLVGAPSPEALIASGLDALLGRYRFVSEDGRELAVDDLPIAAALRGQTPAPLLLRAIDGSSPESDRWIVSRAAPVHDAAGELQLVVTVSEDVTAVKREELGQRMLSSASKLLGSSLNVGATIDKAAWAVVPELADWARIDLPDERGELAQAAVAHRELEKVELLREWRRDFPPAPHDSRGPAEVMRTGRSVVWARVDAEDIDRYAQAPRHAELMRLIDTQSIVIVPLSVGEQVIGTMQLATTAESGRVLGPADLELAEELARRAAIAVENARLHEARTHIATTLQRSLLPPRLPVIPGLTIAARFRAAGPGAEVGGDFYDLFEGRDGWMVVMGDVTGKGPGAAAITSLARYTMRTAAHYEDDPCAMLRRLNAALGADPERRQICTAVCVGVRQDGAAGVGLEIVCAGHPSPFLVRADGSVRAVGTPGTLLGAFPDGRWTTTDLTLGEGDALVLYTDGVTDTRGPAGRFGSDRLEALLREIGPLEPDQTAERIDDALQAFGEQRDDVALLVLCAGGRQPGHASAVVDGYDG